MDNTLKIPLPVYVVAVVLFPMFGVVFLLLDHHWSAAFLSVVGLAYAIGLGRVLLWRRLGRPRVPARRGAGSLRTQRPTERRRSDGRNAENGGHAG